MPSLVSPHAPGSRWAPARPGSEPRRWARASTGASGSSPSGRCSLSSSRRPSGPDRVGDALPDDRLARLHRDLVLLAGGGPGPLDVELVGVARLDAGHPAGARADLVDAQRAAAAAGHEAAHAAELVGEQGRAVVEREGAGGGVLGAEAPGVAGGCRRGRGRAAASATAAPGGATAARERGADGD